MRRNNRKSNELRAITVRSGINKYAEGSVEVSFGDTKIVCTATVETKLPSWMKAQGVRGKGWVTAEYGMIPRSTHLRMDREAVKGQGGRTQEIQRLIARSLRSVVDLKALGEIQVKIDCDVLQADGGTRVASICGAYIALYQALLKIDRLKALKTSVAAVSCGIINGEAVLDLDYDEDSAAEVDANFVMTGDGRLVEVQATGEENTFTQDQLTAMLELARAGIVQITQKQKEAIS